LLKGLEINEVRWSNVLSASYSQRIDSTFFLKEFFSQPFTENCLPLSVLCKIKSGTTPSDRDGELKKGVVLLKTANIRNKVLDFSSPSDFFFIDADTHKKMIVSSLQKDDVLINIVGATTDVIGRCAILSSNFPQANITQAMALLRINNEYINILKPHYLFAYLISKEGHKQVRQIARPTGQFNMNIKEVGSFLIPLLRFKFQTHIEKVIKESEIATNRALTIYNQAETQLFNALGMADFWPSTENVNIKSFKESFLATGRLDAEYYQPKYEQVMNKITLQSHACLVELVNIQKSIEPGSDIYSDDDDSLPFLRVADYSKYGLTQPQKYLKPTFVAENYAELELLKPKKNTILFSKDGSVGEAYCLQADADFVTSSAILHLTVRDTNQLLPDYLTLALNSKLVKMQAERDAGGSIILHWRVGEIENVVVPLVDMFTQSKIAHLVQESFSLKAESERLLDVAKRAVEIAIEQDEAAGMAYIEANIE